MWTVWLLSATLAATAWTLWRRVGINLSLSSVLLGMLLLFHGPAYIYYTRWWGPETAFYDVILSAAKGQDVLPTLDLALALTLLLVCAGVITTDLLSHVGVRKWRHALERWAVAEPGASAREQRRVVLAGTLLGLCVLLPFVFIDDQLPKVANYFTADLGEFEKIALRRELGGSELYIYNLLLTTLLPFVAFCMLALMRHCTPPVAVLAWMFIGAVALAKAATLSKAPLAVFALQCGVVWLMLRRLTLSARLLALLAVSATLLFGAMSLVANPGVEEIQLVLDFLFYRVFMIVNEGLFEYFAAIPHAIPHSWGSQFSWLAAALQSGPSLPTYWLVGELHRDGLASTTTVMFVGDAWADFAWAGVVAAAFAIGALVRWIDIQLIVRRGKTMATVAGLALGQFGLFIAMSTSLQTALLTGGLALVLPLVWLFRSSAHAARRRARPTAAMASADPGSAG